MVEEEPAPNALLNGLLVPVVAYAEKALLLPVLPPNTEDLAGDPERLFFPKCPKPNAKPTPECPRLGVEEETKVGGGDLGRLAAEANGDDEDANASKPVRFCGACICGVDKAEDAEADGENAEAVIVDVVEAVDAGVDVREDGESLEGDEDGVKENDDVDGEWVVPAEVVGDHGVFGCAEAEELEEEANTFGPLTVAKGELVDAYAMKPL